uniref:Uncharacterized protein n=1 Tax=Rhizophora mucronata TaxID=61149 RepID=A0A2P2IU00_RHIMU
MSTVLSREIQTENVQRITNKQEKNEWDHGRQDYSFKGAFGRQDSIEGQ